jgi:hypothetical protein
VGGSRWRTCGTLTPRQLRFPVHGHDRRGHRDPARSRTRQRVPTHSAVPAPPPSSTAQGRTRESPEPFTSQRCGRGFLRQARAAGLNPARAQRSLVDLVFELANPTPHADPTSVAAEHWLGAWTALLSSRASLAYAGAGEGHRVSLTKWLAVGRRPDLRRRACGDVLACQADDATREDEDQEEQEADQVERQAKG